MHKAGVLAMCLLAWGSVPGARGEEGHLHALPQPIGGERGAEEPGTRGPTEILTRSAARHGSGTSWMPESTPRYHRPGRAGRWDLMYHGAAHLAWDHMGGPRGGEKLIAPNWGMAVAERGVGSRSRWRLAAMLSLDPLTVGGSGYPLLFQSGESWRGEPLRDRQHPHNYFMELSGTYSHAFAEEAAAFLYVAPVGEPALGPPAFMHRTFALDSPLAPLGHHWQDSTHITYGVVTAGLQKTRGQLEISTFTGREPGENRMRFEDPRFDSYSGRFTYNPSRDLSLQVSHGYLHSPEALHPEVDVHRTTASAVYNRPSAGGRNFQSALVWGQNRTEGQSLDSWLLEATWKHDGGWTPFVRYENVRKSAEELVLPDFPAAQAFRVQQVILGVARDLRVSGDWQWGIGGQVVLNVVPAALRPVYGNSPAGVALFVRVHPRQMKPSVPAGEGMHMHH